MKTKIMIDANDLLAALPPPRDDEQPSLRNDIVDELLDHLQSAFRREVLKDGDEAAAEQRVLDRFGDPKKLARRLWWQAMWSRVMGKRILAGLQWLVSLAAVVLAVMVLRQQSEILTEMNASRIADANWRQNLSVTLNELRNRLPTPMGSTGTVHFPPELAAQNSDGGAAGSMPAGGSFAKPFQLTVKLVQEKENGEPLTSPIREMTLTGSGQSISGTGQQFNDAALQFLGAMAGNRPLLSSNGCFIFDHLEPDRYELKIILADGQTSTQPVVIRDDQPQELTVICPKPRKKALVRVRVSRCPNDLLQAGFTTLTCAIREQPLILGTTTWTPMPSIGLREHQLILDTQTGLTTRIHSGQWLDLRDVPEKERVVFLPVGPIGLKMFMNSACESLASASVNEAAPVSPPPPQDGVVPMIPLEIEPGENRLQVHLSEEFFAEARRQMRRAKSEFPDAEQNSELPQSLVVPEIVNPLDPTPPGAPANVRLDTVSVNLVREDGIAIIPDAAAVEIVAGKLAWTLDHVLNSKRTERGDVARKATGIYQVAGIKPDRYRLRVRLSDGQHFERPLLVRGDKPVELTFVCPPPRPKIAVQVSAPALPDDLREAGATLSIETWDRFVEFKDVKWQNSESKYQRIDFDPQTGAVTKIEHPTEEMVDVSQAPLEDRAVFLSTGPANVAYTITLPTGPNTFAPIKWPQEDGESVYHVKGDAETWKLELPEELVTAARKKLSQSEAK